MVLKSRLFRADPKLEAAATVDSGHVLQGASGPHVAKLQQALNLVAQSHLIADGRYGPRTAAAVADFKRRRAPPILNYKGEIDDIVGVKTMAALDAALVALEPEEPGELTSLFPPPLSKAQQATTPSPVPLSPTRLRLGIAIGDSAPGQASVIDLVSAPVGQTVVVPPNRSAVLQTTHFAGGVLVLANPPSQNTTKPLSKILTGANFRESGALQNVDIVDDIEKFNYRTFAECGVVKVQAVGPGTKKSAICDVLILVSTSSYVDEPVHPVDSTLPLGLVSTEGTPLNPLPGRRINIFGRGESNGFENYSSSIPFCNDSGGNTKPWTDDPRKSGGPGIGPEAVMNICIRSSPIFPITIAEIKRISANGCRVTVCDAKLSRNRQDESWLSQGRGGQLQGGPEGRIRRGARLRNHEIVGGARRMAPSGHAYTEAIEGGAEAFALPCAVLCQWNGRRIRS